MNNKQIEQCLGFLDEKLAEMHIKANILLLGGAWMITQIGNRKSTQDIDMVIATNDWWGHVDSERLELIAEPPLPAVTPEGKQWAAFCAAVVEALCRRAPLASSAWTEQPDYFLADPWFYPIERKALGVSAAGIQASPRKRG